MVHHEYKHESIIVMTCSTWHHQIVPNLPSGQNVITPRLLIPQRTQRLTHEMTSFIAFITPLNNCPEDLGALCWGVSISGTQTCLFSSALRECEGDLPEPSHCIPPDPPSFHPAALCPLLACAEDAHLPSTVRGCTENQNISVFFCLSS